MSEQDYQSVFDIIGPVMIGPSSSHTAGAARIGKVVHDILGQTPTSVTIYLYGSFAKTYRGHGTDLALAGGILGMMPDDARLRESLEIAQAQGVAINFIPTDAPSQHPNTAKIVVNAPQPLTVIGSSIGGGQIKISEVDGFQLQLKAGTPTILVVHQDLPGMIYQVAGILATAKLNISTMRVSRMAKGEKAIMLIEIDEFEIGQVLSQLRQLDHLYAASFFN